MSTIVFSKSGTTVTRVQAARLSERKFTYTVLTGNGQVSSGWLTKADAVAEAKRFISEVAK